MDWINWYCCVMITKRSYAIYAPLEYQTDGCFGRSFVIILWYPQKIWSRIWTLFGMILNIHWSIKRDQDFQSFGAAIPVRDSKLDSALKKEETSISDDDCDHRLRISENRYHIPFIFPLCLFQIACFLGRRPAFRDWHLDFGDATLKTGVAETLRSLRIVPGRVWGKSKKEKFYTTFVGSESLGGVSWKELLQVLELLDLVGTCWNSASGFWKLYGGSVVLWQTLRSGMPLDQSNIFQMVSRLSPAG